MAEVTSEDLASIRLLICMAKADGDLKDEEHSFLEDAMAGLELPAGVTVESLLSEKNDPVALAQQIKGAEARESDYASLFSMAYCDHNLNADEQILLATLRGAWGIQRSDEEDLRKALECSKRFQAPEAKPHEKISDASRRAQEFDNLLTRYSILAGITGAIPVPLIPDLLVVPMQVKMVYDIAGLYGQKTDKNTVQLMFETLGVGTGARVGISMLAKLIPGWGSAVGATTSFATTYALGKVAAAYYETEGKKPVAAFKDMFQKEREHGKEEYQKQKPALDEAQKAHAATLKQLAYDAQAGRITPEQYEQKVDALQ